MTASVTPIRPAPLAALQGVPATVVGGYLGAGKTTLINRWLAELTPRRWAVLVNDLGALNIDAERLRHHSGPVLELSNGCLCCSLREGLGPALLQLAQRPEPPEHVLIETSGMAIPLRIASQLELHGLSLARLLLVVDLSRIAALWHDPWVGELVQQQFEGVDLLEISKADLLDAATARERHRWLQQALATLQGAPSNATSPPLLPPVHGERQLARSDCWIQTQPLSRAAVIRWGSQLGPEVLRLKGELWLSEHPEGPVRLDRCGSQLDLATTPSGPWPSTLLRRGRLVAISRAGAPEPTWPIAHPQPSPSA